MRFHVLAADYDGTLAHHGVVDSETRVSLESLRRSGRRVMLVTGRQVDDLQRVCPDLDLFDWVVAENGAVLYRPLDKSTRLLAEPPPAHFVQALHAHGVSPLSVGQVVVATWEPHEDQVLHTIRECGLELQVIFNKGAVMVLPTGINKAHGLRAALDAAGYSHHNTLAIGDAENDHALLSACECGIAVGNAIGTLKQRADHVTVGHRGAGVRNVIDALTTNEARLSPRPDHRNRLVLGEDPNGQDAVLDVFTSPVLIAGPSGSGKSTAATSIIEQLADREYQFCILDPEGDYRSLTGAIVVGDGHPPDIHEVLECLTTTRQNVVVNLLDVPLPDRPQLFEALFGRLQELRARTGRPHWIVVDEAHQMLPSTWQPAEQRAPQRLRNILLLTVHPQHVSAPVLADVGTVLAVGRESRETLVAFAGAAGHRKPRAGRGELEPGQALLWRPWANVKPVRLQIHPPRTERRRHVRKYAFGELGPDKSFYFRGPEDRLNLRVQNLQLFMQMAEGIDDQTWLFHLHKHDYSSWMRWAIKDEGLATEVEQVERDLFDNPTRSRARVRAAIELRYTGPA